MCAEQLTVHTGTAAQDETGRARGCRFCLRRRCEAASSLGSRWRCSRRSTTRPLPLTNCQEDPLGTSAACPLRKKFSRSFFEVILRNGRGTRDKSTLVTNGWVTDECTKCYSRFCRSLYCQTATAPHLLIEACILTRISPILRLGL